MPLTNYGYLADAHRRFVVAMRPIIRDRLKSQFGDDWFETGVKSGIGKKWGETRRFRDQNPHRTLVELLDQFHITQLVAHYHETLFVDLFPDKTKVDHQLGLLLRVRNTELGHFPDRELADYELDLALAAMIAILRDAELASVAESLEELRMEASSKGVVQAHSDASPECGPGASEWVPWATEALDEMPKRGNGWVLITNLVEAIARRHPEFASLIGSHPEDFPELLRRHEESFEVTMPSKARRGGNPYVRLDSDRLQASPGSNWPETLSEILDRSNRRKNNDGRTLPNVRRKLIGQIPDFDERDYGYATFEDLLIAHSGRFRLRRQGGKTFVSEPQGR